MAMAFPFNRAPLVNEQGQVNQAWLQYFIDLNRAVSEVAAVEGETAANLGDASADINTIGKYTNKMVTDDTNFEILKASGPDPTDTWVNYSGGSNITPA